MMVCGNSVGTMCPANDANMPFFGITVNGHIWRHLSPAAMQLPNCAVKAGVNRQSY